MEFIFIYVKYSLLDSHPLPFRELVSRIYIVAAVSGLIVLFFVIFALLGKRKMDRELDG